MPSILHAQTVFRRDWFTGVTLGAALAVVAASVAVFILAVRDGAMPGLALLLITTGLLCFGWLFAIALTLRRGIDGIRKSAEEIAEQSAIIALNTGAFDSLSPPPDDVKSEMMSEGT